jgi:GH35 family endo-1,4-beta-xylanase
MNIYKTILILLVSGQLKAQTLKSLLPQDKYIGTIVNANFFENPLKNEKQYDSIIKTQFNGIVAENNYKMAILMPNEPKDPFNLSLKDINTAYLDKLVNFGIQNKMIVRGHCLIWQNQVPQWLSIRSKKWTNKQIYAFTKQYITLVVSYTKGKIMEWDVVNEGIDDRSPKLRSNTWYDNVTNKQDFINQCFVYAKKADPNALLFYNDFSIEGFQEKEDSRNHFMLTMVKSMRDHKIPIDGVGLQCHLVNNQLEDGYIFSIGRTIDEIASIGLKCSITEFDIRICNNQNAPSREQLEFQKQKYQKMILMLLGNKGVTGITFWGFTDKYSWIPAIMKDCGYAHIYDSNYKAKPAYQGVVESLKELQNNTKQKTFFNNPIEVPGVIEFENYDYGSKGVSFMDRDDINNGNYTNRKDPVDLIQESNGNIILGYTEAGEWLSYTINIKTTGLYDFDISNCSAETNNAYARIEIDNIRVASSFAFVPNASWSAYKNDVFHNIPLPKGIHTLKFYIEKGPVNLDKMKIHLSK